VPAAVWHLTAGLPGTAAGRGSGAGVRDALSRSHALRHPRQYPAHRAAAGLGRPGRLPPDRAARNAGADCPHRSGRAAGARSGVIPRGLSVLSRTLSVRPRAGGDPGAKLADGKTGSPLSWGRTEREQRPTRPERAYAHSPIQLSNSHAIASPDLASGAGWPVSFPSPQLGEWHAEKAHGLDFARPARSDGRARIAGTLAHQRMRPRPLDAPRGITAFAFTASRTEPAVFVPRGGFPSAARGGGLC